MKAFHEAVGAAEGHARPLGIDRLLLDVSAVTADGKMAVAFFLLALLQAQWRTPQQLCEPVSLSIRIRCHHQGDRLDRWLFADNILSGFEDIDTFDERTTDRSTATKYTQSSRAARTADTHRTDRRPSRMSRDMHSILVIHRPFSTSLIAFTCVMLIRSYMVLLLCQGLAARRVLYVRRGGRDHEGPFEKDFGGGVQSGCRSHHLGGRGGEDAGPGRGSILRRI
eukprot:scaffold310742_cov28-Prasinocladus_malaysianus.AAC.1